MHTIDPDTIREAVRSRYVAAATAVTSAQTQAGCCGSNSAADSCCGGPSTKDPITSDLYSIDELNELPSAAVLGSLGCGNPTALAELKSGEVVLDLGSGGGIDVLLSARRAGPTGFAYGLDMTDEMLQLAERNAAEPGVHNVKFLKGEIEHIPLPDASADVVISNCVINLSSDKPQVLREAAGFEQVEFEVTRVYDSASSYSGDSSPQATAFEALAAAGGRFVSAFVRARKPVSFR